LFSLENKLRKMVTQSLDPRPRIMIGGVRPTASANYYSILEPSQNLSSIPQAAFALLTNDIA
jgi:hypothetical protein